MHARYLAEDAVTMDRLPDAQIAAMNHDMVDDMIAMMDVVDAAVIREDMRQEALRPPAVRAAPASAKRLTRLTDRSPR